MQHRAAENKKATALHVHLLRVVTSLNTELLEGVVNKKIVLFGYYYSITVVVGPRTLEAREEERDQKQEACMQLCIGL